MSATLAAPIYAGTLEERLNKLRGLLDYLPPELPLPERPEDSRYFVGRLDLFRKPQELRAAIEKTFNLDSQPIILEERGAGILDTVRQIQKCYTVWDSSKVVDFLIASVYKTCEGSHGQVPSWERVLPKRPRGRPVRGSAPTKATDSSDASPAKRAAPEPGSSPKSQPIGTQVKKRKLDKEVARPSQNTVHRASTPTRVNGKPSEPDSPEENRLPSEDQDRYQYENRTPSKRFWDPNGTVVIQVDTTLYRLNAKRLSSNSGYFHNNISEEATPDQDTLDGCPVYLVEQVTTKDFEYLLSMFEDATQIVLEPQPVSVLASIFRAANTLKFNKFRVWSIRELEGRLSNDVTSITQEPLEGSVEALNLALDLDISSIIKRARYEIARISSPEWFALADLTIGENKRDDSQVQVPLRDILVLSIARETLLAKWMSLATTAPVDFASLEVQKGQKVCCPRTAERVVGWNKLVHDSGVYQEWMYDPIYGLQILSELPWEELKYCKECIRKRKDIWRYQKKEMWEDFEAILGPQNQLIIC